MGLQTLRRQTSIFSHLWRGSGLSRSCIWHGSISTGDPHHRGVQVVESGALGDASRDLSAHPVLGPAALHSDCVACLLHRLVHSVHVQRADGTEVDNLGRKQNVSQRNPDNPISQPHS